MTGSPLTEDLYPYEYLSSQLRDTPECADAEALFFDYWAY